MRSDDYILTDSEVEEFDRLYDGNLTEEEYYVIKAKLKLDEVLQHKFIVYKLLRREIELDGLANKILKERFTAVELRIKKKSFRLFSILSSILLVVMISFFLTYKNNNIKIYEKYRDSESGISIRMNNHHKSNLDTAMIEIAKGEYNQAIFTLSNLTATDTALYYKAYCNERLGKYEDAASIYASLIQSNAMTIRQKSNFRSVLLKLRSGDKNAIIDLKTIAADPENLYNRTAREIINSMGE